MTRVVRPASIVAACAILILFATVPAAYAEGPDQTNASDIGAVSAAGGALSNRAGDRTPGVASR